MLYFVHDARALKIFRLSCRSCPRKYALQLLKSESITLYITQAESSNNVLTEIQIVQKFFILGKIYFHRGLLLSQKKNSLNIDVRPLIFKTSMY